MKHKILSCLLFCVCFAIMPLVIQAARLYLEPASGQYQLGDTFIIEIRLDSEQEYVNAVEANLVFPQDILEVKDFSQGNSILTLWVKTPSFSNQTGVIFFAGGVPGGYEGGSEMLGKIIFKAKNQGQAEIKIQDDSQVLLNDGLGTPAKLTTKGATFTILLEKAEVPKDEWQKEIEKDKISPESFKVEVSQDPLIFEGKYFIIFSTTDKQTGINYYEIKEGDKAWKRGQSPYLLEDQNLSGIIKVKAVDKAGNVRVAEYIPPEIPKEPLPWLEIVLILIGIGIIIWITYKILRKK